MNEVTEEMWKNIKTKIDLRFENHEDWEQENPELMKRLFHY